MSTVSVAPWAGTRQAPSRAAPANRATKREKGMGNGVLAAEGASGASEGRLHGAGVYPTGIAPVGQAEAADRRRAYGDERSLALP